MLITAGGAILSAAKSGAVAEGAEALKEGIAQLFGAPSPVVRGAIDRVKALRARALTGEVAAVVALCYEAFEPRKGEPGDPRTPVDGKRSPEDARTLARRALAAYVEKFGALPEAAARWAVTLNAPVDTSRTSLADAARQAITEGVERGVQSAAGERIDLAARRALPVVAVVVGVVLVGFIAYRVVR